MIGCGWIGLHGSRPTGRRRQGAPASPRGSRVAWTPDPAPTPCKPFARHEHVAGHTSCRFGVRCRTGSPGTARSVTIDRLPEPPVVCSPRQSCLVDGLLARRKALEDTGRPVAPSSTPHRGSVAAECVPPLFRTHRLQRIHPRCTPGRNERGSNRYDTH